MGAIIMRGSVTLSSMNPQTGMEEVCNDSPFVARSGDFDNPGPSGINFSLCFAWRCHSDPNVKLNASGFNCDHQTN
ncbi:MAG: hypothetical protein EPO32_12685 [Anaerolineae bacterium]|nr:MAG: hypothetical protein EPO32_12685 [Anaerolineae bacterium]